MQTKGNLPTYEGLTVELERLHKAMKRKQQIDRKQARKDKRWRQRNQSQQHSTQTDR